MSQPDDQDPLLYERDGDVAILSFNIPKRLNPLTQPLQEALRQRLAQLRDEGEVRAVVLTGVGKSFCVGADLGSMDASAPGSLGQRTADAMEAMSNRLIEDLRSMP